MLTVTVVFKVLALALRGRVPPLTRSHPDTGVLKSCPALVKGLYLYYKVGLALMPISTPSPNPP